MSIVRICAYISSVALGATSGGSDSARDFTTFQSAAPYSPELDIASDTAIVYGVNETLPARIGEWRAQGYAAAMMMGIAWGDYGAYFGTGAAWKRGEIQTLKDGSLRLHNPNSEIGYNVPTMAYVEYIKTLVDKAVDARVQAIYLEEPEYWADTGWSEAFKREWQDFYHEPWQAPDSSPDAQYRASKLKYELYFRALKEVFGHVAARAKAANIHIDCVVPTHSLVSYAQWRIVSPESHLIDIPALDGYVAQVWTGTARSPNMYAGARKERTFETAFLEYGQMLGMVRPTGRKVWFLADPVEDDPNHSWNDYKLNYECTLIASLMWPDVHRYEVMPWPDRIFRGAYPKINMDAKSNDREGIPSDYATQLLVSINALNEMDQSDVSYDTGSRGVGVIISDTTMFQRAEPQPSDPSLGAFYALALPLLKAGVPIEVVQLENTVHANTLDAYKVLLLTYDGQKPLKSAYHEALDRWVRGGGGLVFVDDGSDPYNGVREWWNEQGKTKAKPEDDLFRRLGVTSAAETAPQSVDKGFVRVLRKRPHELMAAADGPGVVRSLVEAMFVKRGEPLKTQNYLVVRRGPFVIASVLEESVSNDSLKLAGSYVDLFQAALPVVREIILQPGQRTLLYNLDWAKRHAVKAKVVAAGARIRQEELNNGVFRFHARGPKGSTATARVLLPGHVKQLTTTPAIDVKQDWDAATSTLGLSFPNSAQDVLFVLNL